MHELSLCENILQTLESCARTQAFQRVKTVYLEVGALAAVDPDSLRFSFDAVTRSTLAEAARLEIIDVAGAGWCAACHTTSTVRQFFDACPSCGHYPLQITAGDGLKIKQLEVE